MILKKPYAFLIRKFKIIHLIMSSLMIYLAFKTSHILSYLKEYISSSVILRENASNYFNSLMFLSVIIIVAFSFVIYWLLKHKEKPRLTYMITIVGYIFIIIVFYNSFSLLKTLETEIVVSKTIRLWKDLLNIALYYQYVIIFIMLIRGLGFNIKQFDFKKDLEELDIETKDNEEFEFILDTNNNKISRNIRKRLRHLRYFFIEHKFIITMLLSIIGTFVIILLAINIFITGKIYKENESFRSKNNIITITDSYTTNLTSQRKYITNNNNMYIIIKMKINSPSNTKTKLTITDFRLLLDNKKYFPVIKHCLAISDIGNCYNKQNITNKSKEYILMYQIPSNTKYKKIMLEYVDEINITNIGIESKYKKIKLHPSNIDKVIETNTNKINEIMSINNNFIKNTSITITNYNIASKFTHTYNKCSNNVCIPYNEVILTNNIGVNPKTILKLNIVYNSDMSINKFIEKYAVLKYKIADKEYSSNITNKTPSTATDTLYLEVNNNVLLSNVMYLEFNIRNNKYIYYLKS